MISMLIGEVMISKPFYIVLNVKGVGYEVNVPLGIGAKEGDSLTLYTRMVVRENFVGLYGFIDSLQKNIFDLLISVSGVGPKAGLSILSAMEVKEVISALAEEDTAAFQKVKGIGGKTAQNLIVNLKDKAKVYGIHQKDVTHVEESDERIVTAVNALMSLGYKQPEAKKMVGAVVKLGMSETVEEIIALALRR